MDYIRAVIYCRCSTEEESQINALQNQVQESEACVLAQRWHLVDRYVESKSGTTTKGRDEYNRLYEDLLSDRFDVIVILSSSSALVVWVVILTIRGMYWERHSRTNSRDST